ncbi:MAG TPA: DNA translocase FtsK, partial [Verrucomicrobiae bacterium]|nr:DNA translocase FtsK [Verrucomicrobiae bacterium]
MSDTRAKKSQRRPVPVKIVLSIAGVLIIVFSIITLIGFFGEGGTVGQTLSQLFQQILGKAAWIGPFITAAIGFLLIGYQPGRPSEKKGEGVSEKSHKPAGADIVSRGTGFKDYFTGPEPVDEKTVNQTNPELDEVGKNFKSYFGSKGETRRDAKLVSKGDGFSDYFASGEFAAAASTEVELDDPEMEGLPSLEPLEHENTFRAIVGQVLSDRQANKENKANQPGTVTQPSFQVVPGGRTEDPAAEQFKLEVVAKPVRSESAPVSITEEKQEFEPPKEVSLPPVVLLDPPVPCVQPMDDNARENATLLENVLSSFGVKVKVTDISQGPAITRYEIQPAPGIKISRIVGLADDIALALAAQDVRIEAPIPGKSAVGIEVPNKKVSMVRFREVMESEEFTRDSKLKVALGKDIAGKPVVADLSRMPHLLVAGATGSGKSVCMNTIITSILYAAKPNEVKFLLIDPKMVELAKYNGIPHLIAPVVTDPKKAAVALRWVVNEMETRYELFAAAGVRDITRYNEVIADKNPLPFVVVLIDELADLMMVSPGDVEEAICRLAQMARAAGIHLVVATQRPSVDV